VTENRLSCIAAGEIGIILRGTTGWRSPAIFSCPAAAYPCIPRASGDNGNCPPDDLRRFAGQEPKYYCITGHRSLPPEPLSKKEKRYFQAKGYKENPVFKTSVETIKKEATPPNNSSALLCAKIWPSPASAFLSGRRGRFIRDFSADAP